jgi:small subunit ribosomal protein S17e
MTVDPTEIMDMSDRLLEQYPKSFTDEFDANKRLVEQLTDIRTHHTVNRIAGHITRRQKRD